MSQDKLCFPVHFLTILKHKSLGKKCVSHTNKHYSQGDRLEILYSLF